MFKLFVFAALFALAAARPGYLASSPVVYSSHYAQPVHYSVHKTLVPVVHKTVVPVVHRTVVPVVRTQVVNTVVSTPVVHAAPVVHASPLYHSVAIGSSYAPAYGILKK
ncbi:uncharacterized protein LOC119602059 [Lucilia sericata]|uniref:uncharacterized protein LOC119602059 n=1 Tax=Lucilia sericata TaxID=13632 RepID=UPI0018A80688|nr:uncharacterized protein LOC119602059 [Lucilia sericata]